eukprot:1196420-Prorocentrum_minimum.AAC.3
MEADGAVERVLARAGEGVRVRVRRRKPKRLADLEREHQTSSVDIRRTTSHHKTTPAFEYTAASNRHQMMKGRCVNLIQAFSFILIAGALDARKPSSPKTHPPVQQHRPAPSQTAQRKSQSQRLASRHLIFPGRVTSSSSRVVGVGWG